MSNQVRKPKPSMRAQAAARAEQEAAASARRRRSKQVALGVAGGLVLIAVVATVALLALRGSSEEEVAAVDPTALELGCTSCHSIDGRRSEGPTWKGLWGSEVTLADGSVVVADEAYLTRAILDPAAEVRQGFQPGMPALEVTDEQLDALLAHLEELGS